MVNLLRLCTKRSKTIPVESDCMDTQQMIDTMNIINSCDRIITSYWSQSDILESISESVKEILGWDPKDLTGSSWYDLNASKTSGTYFRLHRCGSEVYFENICSGYTSSGSFYLMERVFDCRFTCGIHKSPSSSQLSDFFENGSIPLRMIGIDGAIIWANNAELKLLGYERNEYVGKSASQFYADYNSYSNMFQKLNSGEGIHDYPIRLKCKNGTTKDVLIDSTVAWDDDGKFLYTRCFTRDMTATDKINELRIAEKAKCQTLKYKTNFLATVTHEIRTPLNGIIGMASLLLETAPFTPLQKEYVETIAITGDFLLTLVNDILDLSKVDSGKMVIESIPFNIVKVVEDVRKMSISGAEQKGLNLLSLVDNNLQSVENILTSNDFSESIYLGDPFRLKQILINYVNNAVKFTAHGTVSIGIDIKKSKFAEDIDEVTLTVEDTGIGVASTVDLFEPFSQADNTISRRYGGTGLGLSICRKLGRLMGGETGVRSTLGQGSTFWVSLPLHRYPHQSRQHSNCSSDASSICDVQQAAGKLPCNVKILIAEDNKVNQKVATRMLSKLGYSDVTIVENGLLAVDAIKNVLSNEVDLGSEGSREMQAVMYDIILMDMQMPLMDGLEATRTIRSMCSAAAASSHIPILALTANADSSDRTLCLDSGMDDFMTKPLTLESLREGLRKWTMRMVRRSFTVNTSAVHSNNNSSSNDSKVELTVA